MKVTKTVNKDQKEDKNVSKMPKNQPISLKYSSKLVPQKNWKWNKNQASFVGFLSF